MSLNWSTEKCPDGAEATEEEAGIREGLIFATMGVDIGELKESNLEEFRWRLLVLDMIFGNDTYEQMFTPEVLWRWRGLKTNVVTKTRAQWWAKMRDSIAIGRRFDDKVKREFGEFRERTTTA